MRRGERSRGQYQERQAHTLLGQLRETGQVCETEQLSLGTRLSGSKTISSRSRSALEPKANASFLFQGKGRDRPQCDFLLGTLRIVLRNHYRKMLLLSPNELCQTSLAFDLLSFKW